MKTITWTPDFENNHLCYDSEDREQLRMIDSVDEYIFECFDEVQTGFVGTTIDAALADNETIYVYGYERDIPSIGECSFLDDLIEHLDEERGDPDGGLKTVNEADMVELYRLESAFIDELRKRYNPWSCEIVARICVPFRDFYESLDDKDKQFLSDSFGK